MKSDRTQTDTRIISHITYYIQFFFSQILTPDTNHSDICMLRSFKVVSNIQIQSAAPELQIQSVAPELQIQIRGGMGLAAVVVSWIQRGSAMALGSNKRQQRQRCLEGSAGWSTAFSFFFVFLI